MESRDSAKTFELMVGVCRLLLDKRYLLNSGVLLRLINNRTLGVEAIRRLPEETHAFNSRLIHGYLIGCSYGILVNRKLTNIHELRTDVTNVTLHYVT